MNATRTIRSETERVDLSIIRYAMCWEDADVMLEALDVQPGDVCLSIASGGENSLSLLTCSPARVIALDLSPAQIACVELKCAAFRRLDYPELLELLGAQPSGRRPSLFQALRPLLSPGTRRFWDQRPGIIADGIGAAGKFERYFTLFRRWILPLIHRRHEIAALFAPKPQAERERFFRETWNNRRWRGLLRLFLSRPVMGRLGRDPEFFRYAQGDTAHETLQRIEHALTVLDPAQNPYFQWIVFGRFTGALPHALRPENFDLIRHNIDALEWRLASLEATLAELGEASIDRFNLSDIFEYLSPAASDTIFGQIAHAGRRGGRLAYWNMMVPRTFPAPLRNRFRPLPELAARLLAANRAAFYRSLHIAVLS